MGNKICKRCKKEKGLEYFHKANTKDGHDNTCKECRKEIRRLRNGTIPLNTDPLSTLICPVCGKELPTNNFRPYSKSKTGRYWMCDSCYEYHKSLNISGDKNYFRKLRLRLCPEYREEVNAQKKKSRLNNFESAILQQCRRRARDKGIEFNLELEDIHIPEVCPLLEIPLVKGAKGNYQCTPSIDRIDNSKGYVKGNVWIISMKANSMKNCASSDELITFAKNILRYSPNCRECESAELQDKEPVR